MYQGVIQLFLWGCNGRTKAKGEEKEDREHINHLGLTSTLGMLKQSSSQPMAWLQIASRKPIPQQALLRPTRGLNRLISPFLRSALGGVEQSAALHRCAPSLEESSALPHPQISCCCSDKHRIDCDVHHSCPAAMKLLGSCCSQPWQGGKI